MFKLKLRKKSEKCLKEDKPILTVFTVLFAIYAAVLIFVFVWIIINSFKTRNDFYSESKNFFPTEGWHFDNYLFLFENTFHDKSLSQMFLTSIILCITIPTISVAVTTCLAYVLAKYKFKGNKFIYFLFILPMLIMITGTTATLWDVLNSVNLVDTYFGYILISIGVSSMNFLLVYGTFKNVSDSYIEAAKIDGASDFKIFIKIMLPEALGIIGTIWMLGFIGVWNEYASINIFLPSYPTVSVGVQQIGTDIKLLHDNYGDYPKYFAAIMTSIIPIVILFLVFQKRILKMSLGGGIKG